MCKELLQKASDAVQKEDFVTAETIYLDCLKCDPANGEANRELGMMYWARFKRIPEAISFIEKSLASEDCADGHLYLAMVTQNYNRPRALIEFERAIAVYRSEQNATGLMGWAHCNYAHVLSREGNLSAAEKHYQEAIRIDPENEEIQTYHTRFREYLLEIGEKS